MNKEYLKKRLPLLLLVFAFGGIFGFIYEEIFYYFDLGEWVKRGTTFGPWIPIYGFGGNGGNCYDWTGGGKDGTRTLDDAIQVELRDGKWYNK